MLALAVAAALASPTTAQSPTVAEIARLEQQWGQAFVTRDFDFIEGIVAPNYRLVVAGPDGRYSITHRSEWMKNARAFMSHAFSVETVDVNLVGNTAVASARGEWTVARRPGEAARPTRFFVTDTWVRKNGRWQVIHRYSHRLPSAPPPPVQP